MSQISNPPSAGAADGAGIRQAVRGLHLRTHPDADKSAAQVMLVHADEIVLSDGSRITPSDGLLANMAVSGIGGLRAGQVEAASTWYKVLIGQGGSGIGLWLEQAKDYFLDESQTTTSAGLLNIRNAATNLEVAQSFDTDTTGPIPFIDVALARVASPTGRIWVELRANNAGDPAAAVLATSDKLDVSALSTTAGAWVRFVFRTPYTVTAGTTYYYVITGDWTVSGTNYVTAHGVASNAYAAGFPERYNGTSWTDHSATGDLAFRVYVTRNDNAVAPPTGYDAGYALIGWVYNNGSSNFVGFVAHDRLVRAVGLRADNALFEGVNLGNYPYLLYAIDRFIPPVPVRVTCLLYCDAASNLLIGNVPDAFGSGMTYANRGGELMGTNGAIGQVSSPVATEAQALYMGNSAGNMYAWLTNYEWM